MLFRHLQIHNFLSFKGTNTLEFPDAAKCDHSMMLVLGPNTSGKTNIIRALRFLFCDDSLGYPKDLHKLINDAVVATAHVGTTVEAWVEAKILYRERERTIRRRIGAKCVRSGALMWRETTLEERRYERGGDRFVSDQGEIRRALSLMVPPELFDYFFFEGETLAQHLVGGKDTKGIRDGLAALIHEHEWKACIQTVQSVHAEVARDLKKVGDANKEYAQVIGRLEGIENQLRKKRQERAAVEQRASAAKTRYEECEQQILDLSQGKSFESLNVRVSRARTELATSERALLGIEREIARGIGSSHGLPLLREAFDFAFEQLESMRDQNLLPADVSEGFVNRLLEPKNKTCICGRPLDRKNHAAERKCIEAYRKRTMAVDLNAALLSLLNALEKDTEQGFRRRSSASSSTLGKQLDKRDSAIIAIQDLRACIAGLEDDRQRLNVEAIQRLQAEQRKAAEVETTSGRSVAAADQEIRAYEYQRTQLDAEVRGLERSGANSQIRALLSIQKRAEELAEFIDQARIAVKGAFHAQLQFFVSQYYDAVAPDGSTAWVDSHTLLPAIRVDGEIRMNIGGAQRQLLVLSHIVSLSQLRKWLHDELQELSINAGRIDDHCFVLDSVFGPAADQFREKCAEFLVGKARQIVVLVASQQWDEIVRTRLESFADKAYRLILHTAQENMNPNERQMLFRGVQHEVFGKLKDGERSYTTLEEIECEPFSHT